LLHVQPCLFLRQATVVNQNITLHASGTSFYCSKEISPPIF
jgi:hypothetical protein